MGIETKTVTLKKTTARAISRALTGEDLTKYLDRLATIVHTISRVEVEKATTAANYAARLKELKQELQEISIKIRERKEEKEIPCSWLYHWDTGLKELMADDTGEVVEKDEITEQEYLEHKRAIEQGELPLDATEAIGVEETQPSGD